jgi:hypothetical protein
MKSVLLNMPDEMKDLIKIAAKKEDMSVSAFLRFIIKKYLRRIGSIDPR